jgi:hypothetical protein
VRCMKVPSKGLPTKRHGGLLVPRVQPIPQGESNS